MKKRKTAILLLCTILLSLLNINTPTVSARVPIDYDVITDDGVINNAGVRDNTSANILVTTAGSSRSYIEFNTSTLPTGAIVDNVTLTFTTHTINTPGVTDFYWWELPLQPSTVPDVAASNLWLYGNITLHTNYVNSLNLNNNVTYSVVLGDDAVTDINLHTDWFAVGLTASQINNYIYGDDGGVNESYLTLEYHIPGDYQFNFSGLYYENGTRAGSVTVTAVGVSESFNVDGSVTEYYPTLPTLFQYSLDGGGTRRIYAVGNETIVLTTPDATYSTYQFTIQDYTAKSSLGTYYLEALRTINGTDTLIERGKVTPGTPVPMSLVVGEVYLLRIRWGDGSYSTWGYYVTSSDTTETLTIRSVSFTDQAQVLYNDIHVEATRSGGVITVDYLDDLNNTIWANVTIIIRNGAEVAAYTRNNASYTINYGGFNTTFAYVVTVTGEHGNYGIWGRTFILDQTFTFPDAPDLNGIFGSISQNFIPFILCCIAILVFPVSLQPIGLLAGAGMASIMSFIQWATWGYDFLAFFWFVAIIINLISRVRGE